MATAEKKLESGHLRQRLRNLHVCRSPATVWSLWCCHPASFSTNRLVALPITKQPVTNHINPILRIKVVRQRTSCPRSHRPSSISTCLTLALSYFLNVRLSAILIIICSLCIVLRLLWNRRLHRRFTLLLPELLDLCVGHLENILPQVLDVLHSNLPLHGAVWIFFRQHPLRRPQLSGHQHELIRSLKKLIKRGPQFWARFKDFTTAQHVKSQSSTRDSHRHAANITQIPNS